MLITSWAADSRWVFRIAPGCKRIIINPKYLESLHRPNVSLNWDGIEEVVEGGIRLKTGEVVPLDIIIFGTGYSVLNSVVPSMGLCNRLSGASQEASELLNVKGSEGQMVGDYFKEQGGATAYLGSSMPGFPNLYLLLGRC